MSEATPPIFRAPMRARIVEACPGAGADHNVPAAVAHTFARGGRNLQRTHDREAERQSVAYGGA